MILIYFNIFGFEYFWENKCNTPSIKTPCNIKSEKTIVVRTNEKKNNNKKHFQI